ncbi:unnamed protein product, partial [Pylaiella littoralis]
GTPLQRGNTTSSVGRPKCRTAGHGARDLATASRKEKRSVTCGGTTLAPGKADREEQQSKTRGRSGSSRNNREPWTGPLDIGDGGVPKVPDPITIEREELRRTKARRLAAVRGHCLLSQVSRVLHRRDLSTTARLLASARAEFRAAGDLSGAFEADEALIKIKADMVMQAIEAARKSRNYDRLQELMFE